MPESFLGPFIHDLRFVHPFCMLVSGTTGAGKSTFLRNLIEKEGIKGRINEIFYFMPRTENIKIRVPPHQRFVKMQGLPTQEWVDKNWKPDTSSQGSSDLVLERNVLLRFAPKINKMILNPCFKS